MRLALVLVVTLVATGCTRMHQVYPGHDPDLVWTALIAVAETPDYSIDEDGNEVPEPWQVKENSVWVDAPNSRIEIYRELNRIRYRDNVRPLREHRAWRFQVVMRRDDPPRAIFTSRGYAVPTQAAVEAKRYFADVRDILEYGEIRPVETALQPAPAPVGDLEAPAAPGPATAPDAPAIPAASQPAERDPDAPIADIDEMEPE